MTGSPQSASEQRSTVCCICDGPSPLETSKTDERGKPVHEDCYVRRTISRFRLASGRPATPRNWTSSRVEWPLPQY
jgi:hypothetical protein